MSEPGTSLGAHHDKHVFHPEETKLDRVLDFTGWETLLLWASMACAVAGILSGGPVDQPFSQVPWPAKLATFVTLAGLVALLAVVFINYEASKAMRMNILHRISGATDGTYQEVPWPGVDFARWNAIRELRVTDGVGRERGSVVVTVDWSPEVGGQNPTFKFNPTLYLYRDTGEMQVNVNAIVARPTATRLDFSKNGRAIHRVDADVQVSKTYNYYAWVEVTVGDSHVLVSFEKQSHVVRQTETKRDFVDRKLTDLDAIKRLREATAPRPKLTPAPPAPARVDMLRRVFADWQANKASDQQLADEYERLIASANLSEEEEEQLRAVMLKFFEKDGR